MSREKIKHDASSVTKFLPLAWLFVDETVQRPLNEQWSESLGADFKPGSVGVLHVSERKANEKYHVVDGQHRVHRLLEIYGANGTLVECKVYRGLTRAQEAQLFVDLNNFNRPMRFDAFDKLVMAKDAHAKAISAVAAEHGLKIERFKASHTIAAVAALEDVYYGFARRRGVPLTAEDKAKLANPMLLGATLAVVVGAWGGVADSLTGAVLVGVGRLLAARLNVINLADLVHKLAAYPGGATALVGTATGRRALIGGRVGVVVADVCLDLYNKSRKVGKLEPLR